MKPNAPHKPLPKNAGEASIENLHKLRYSSGRKWTAQIRDDMQRTMQVCGVCVVIVYLCVHVCACMCVRVSVYICVRF